MDENISQVVSDILGNVADNLAQSISSKTLDDVTFQDFSKYEFLLNPSDFKKVDLAPLTNEGINYINDLQSTGSSHEILEYMADLLVRLEASVKKAFAEGTSISISELNTAISKLSIGLLQKEVLHPLYSLHRDLIRQMVDYDRVIPYFFNVHLYKFLKKQAERIEDLVVSRSQLTLDTEQEPAYREPVFDWEWFMHSIKNVQFKDIQIDGTHLVADLEYPFEFYPSGSVNVGTSLVYRQRWKTIGLQPGEIVKTIPLAPGQSEKITTKITRRKKRTTNSESNIESETSSESTDTTKGSNEIIAEAASNENWSMSASASYGIASMGFGASLSGEMGGSKENSSKNTTSSLSEKMKKTASKIRRQTKVTVSTEAETGFEESTTSEVTNKNDEVPLTIQYHMLQYQYEVYTYLFSVKNVVFVAEKVPAPYEINISWVRRNDWIIAEELIDESFRQTLNELIQDEDIDSLINFNSADDHYTSMLKQANTKFANFNTPGNLNGLGGLDVPDIYAEPQRQFDQFRKGEEARLRANKLRDIKRSRLFNHIRDNILHYCRAIWAREDAEQRMLRYKKEGRTVPFIWKGPFVEDGVEEDVTQYQPTEVRVALGDIVNEITPIGFTGNYVVFALAPPDFDSEQLIELKLDTPNGEIKLPLHEVLNINRNTYTNLKGTALRDPALDSFIQEAENLDPESLKLLTDETVLDFISFLPRLDKQLILEGEIIRNVDGKLSYEISTEEWGTYLFKKNATRRFLVDSNNLYVSLLLGSGVALEPFKRAHRFIDVLKADEERKAEVLKNDRRELLKNTPNNFDPDISKVVVAAHSKNENLVGGLLDD
ncbi:hypothetical protein [Aquimarina sp. SS2-1]|uniref:hypothetical protein n=1 Tax=Aquimarina besae TaxID=3342247 RepID=UPI0036701A7A